MKSRESGVGIVMNAAQAVTQGLVENPYIPVTRETAVLAREEVESKLTKQLLPMIQHVTNQEPWYRSRVTIGNLVSGVCLLLAVGGVKISADDQLIAIEVIGAVGIIGGNLYSLYGRWRARKPIGT